MRRRNTVVVLLVLLLVGALSVFLFQRSCRNKTTDHVLKKVVVNEAVRTLLYLPLYHAREKGYFKEEGLDVDIVTGGTATNSFAAMLSGQADFSQADPMYVPISREKGGKTKVIGQVVGRIAVWGLTKNPEVNEITKETIKGKTIATQPRPMTAYTYAIKAITDLGLVPDKDVKIIETQSPNEIVPFLNGQADYAFTLEPNASLAVTKGAKVVLSFPQRLGDQVFTGVMTTEDYIAKHPDTVRGLVNAYQHALQDLKTNPQGGIATAKTYFPQLSEDVLRLAIKRLVDDEVWPTNVGISDESWRKALDVRIKVGDLKAPVLLSEAGSMSFADAARQKYSH